MSRSVIRVNFQPEQKITKAVLNQLTEKVLAEKFHNEWYKMMQSYVDYCIRRQIRPNRRAHYDWANEMLSTVSFARVDI